MNKILLVSPEGGGKTTLMNELKRIDEFQKRNFIAMDSRDISYQDSEGNSIIPMKVVNFFVDEIRNPFILAIDSNLSSDIYRSWKYDFIWLDNYTPSLLYSMSIESYLENKNDVSYKTIEDAEKRLDSYADEIREATFERNQGVVHIFLDIRKKSIKNVALDIFSLMKLQGVKK